MPLPSQLSRWAESPKTTYHLSFYGFWLINQSHFLLLLKRSLAFPFPLSWLSFLLPFISWFKSNETLFKAKPLATDPPKKKKSIGLFFLPFFWQKSTNYNGIILIILTFGGELLTPQLLLKIDSEIRGMEKSYPGFATQWRRWWKGKGEEDQNPSYWIAFMGYWLRCIRCWFCCPSLEKDKEEEGWKPYLWEVHATMEEEDDDNDDDDDAKDNDYFETVKRQHQIQSHPRLRRT